MNSKSATTIVLVALCMLATSTLCAQATHDNRMLTKVSSVAWEESNMAEILGGLWKVTIIVCAILLVVDAVMRFGGSKLGASGMFHSVRFIWFIYGSSVVYNIARTTPLAYREFMGNMYSEFFSQIYAGYFGSGFLNIFVNQITINGVVQSTPVAGEHNGLLQNALFVELIIFVGLRIGALIFSRGLKNGNLFPIFSEQ